MVSLHSTNETFFITGFKELPCLPKVPCVNCNKEIAMSAMKTIKEHVVVALRPKQTSKLMTIKNAEYTVYTLLSRVFYRKRKFELFSYHVS